MNIPGPAVIIAGSGMCSGGRIVEHLEPEIEKPENDIFFVGYQVQGTPRYDILKDGQRPGGYVRRKNEKFFVRAGVEQLSGYSAHADRNGLLDWVGVMSEKTEMIKLVHGDDTARHALRDALELYGNSVEA